MTKPKTSNRYTTRPPGREQREHREHQEALKMASTPDKCVSFHARITKEDSKMLKRKLLELDMTGVEWIHKMIHLPM